MRPNILISSSETDLKRKFGYEFIAHIDGNNAQTLRQFYESIVDVLEIPDFTYTLDALDDALNDLQWLEDQRIILYITGSENFISKERNPVKIGSVLNVLDATAEDWKWLEDDGPNNEKELIIVFEDSARIREMLDREQITYAFIDQLN